jgi:4,5-dihydroxyphthalate decarboxylase
VVAKLKISLACCDYDRTRAMFDGRVNVDSCDVLATPLEPEEAFHRAFKFAEFDVSEISLSSHIMTTSRGENSYIGIPAFVSRLFRHSGIYVRTDRGIRSPEDLKGKIIGLPEYQMTANVWIRGILKDDYGIDPSEIRWRSGGLEDPGREERARINLPASIELQRIPNHRTLSSMLEAGELDGLMSARAPSCFDRGAPGVARLFPDHRKVEEDYFRRTKIFPTMHIIGIRKTLAETHPWLAVNLFKAFAKAKDLCMYEMGQIGHLFTSLPWGVGEFQSAKALMGDDFWSYGFENNLRALETLTRYSFEQGLSQRKVDPRELFTPSSLDLARV